MEQQPKKGRKRARKEYEELPVVNPDQFVPLARKIIDLKLELDEAKKVISERPKIFLKHKKILMKSMETAKLDELNGIQHQGNFWNFEIAEKEGKKKWDKNDLLDAWCDAFQIPRETAAALYALEHETVKQTSHNLQIKSMDHPKRVVGANELPQ
jgi:hypothetical protein